jgi:NAD-dependent SIR2 family protein deacetylase
MEFVYWTCDKCGQKEEESTVMARAFIRGNILCNCGGQLLPPVRQKIIVMKPEREVINTYAEMRDKAITKHLKH